MIIIASQIAQILQYMFLNYLRFQRLRNYTSSTKTILIEALASRSSRCGGTLVGASAWHSSGWGVIRWFVMAGLLGDVR